MSYLADGFATTATTSDSLNPETKQRLVDTFGIDP
jgi:hypothetical protein